MFFEEMNIQSKVQGIFVCYTSNINPNWHELRKQDGTYVERKKEDWSIRLVLK